MNQENTNEPLSKTAVKSRFFAQYWGTKTLYVGGVGKVEVGNGGWNLKHPNFFLQLKPLSKITDEDAIGVANIISTTIHDSISKELVSYYKEDILKDPEVLCYASYKTVDFVRSKGYVVPFMEYSVEDLVSFGWVQLL